MGTVFWQRCCAREEGVCPRDKEGGGIDMLGGVLQKGTPILAQCRMASRFADRGGHTGDKELLGSWLVSPWRCPPSPAAPTPPATWAKLCPSAAARQCPSRGAVAAAGKFAGPAAGTVRRGGARGGRGGCLGCCGGAAWDAAAGLPGVFGRCCPRCCPECSGVPGEHCPGCSGCACRDAREVLAGMLGRWSGGAHPWYSGDTRRLPGGWSRVDRGMLGKCSPG